MSGLSFLIRDMDKRGLRVYAAPSPPPEGSGPDDKAWSWKVQAQVPDVEDPSRNAWVDDWEPHAGTMVEAVKEMELFLVWGIWGKLSGHDWLACDECDGTQLVPKGRGAPSARKRCIMTKNCKGYMRRMPEVFEVVKKLRKPSHHKKPDPNAPKKPRATRKGYDEAIRLEALELLDGGMNQSQACRILKERHEECARIGVSTVSTWKLQRDRLLAAA